jgi:hypothetical protein
VAAVDDDGPGFRHVYAVRSGEHAREWDIHRSRHVALGEFARGSNVDDSRSITPADPVKQRRRRHFFGAGETFTINDW